MSPTPIYESVLAFITGIFKPAVDLIDDLHLSKEEKLQIELALNQAKLQVVEKQLETESRKAEAEARIAEAESKAAVAQAQVLAAEAKGDSWLQRNWRPGLMATIIVMIINNFIILPYLSAVWPAIKATPIPAACWGMLAAATGTYTIGRTLEKKEKIKNAAVVLLNKVKATVGFG